MHEPPTWLQNYQWKWINVGEVFKFLSIPFAFYGHLAQLWSYVVQKVESKLDYWLYKKLSLVNKFQICSKVLVATHVYYSSCWVPSQACYNKLEKLLQDFHWYNSSDKKGFHIVAWEFFVSLERLGEWGFLIVNIKASLQCDISTVATIWKNKLLVMHLNFAWFQTVYIGMSLISRSCILM